MPVPVHRPVYREVVEDRPVPVPGAGGVCRVQGARRRGAMLRWVRYRYQVGWIWQDGGRGRQAGRLAVPPLGLPPEPGRIPVVGPLLALALRALALPALALLALALPALALPGFALPAFALPALALPARACWPLCAVALPALALPRGMRATGGWVCEGIGGGRLPAAGLRRVPAAGLRRVPAAGLRRLRRLLIQRGWDLRFLSAHLSPGRGSLSRCF